jgi:L-threonylcarbamoyladenylate synthase
VTLYLGTAGLVVERLAADARSRIASGVRVGILAPDEDLRVLGPRLAAVGSSGRVATARYGSRRHRDEAARMLFAALRHLDAEGVDEILASAPEPEDIGRAIIDRLTRAAEGRVIRCGEDS